MRVRMCLVFTQSSNGLILVCLPKIQKGMFNQMQIIFGENGENALRKH